MTTEDNVQCHSCNKKLNIEVESRISLSEECEYCYADLHCCKMCTYYDPNVYNECHETNADRVVEKVKKNFCGYFKLVGSKSEEEKQKDHLAAANALFKK